MNIPNKREYIYVGLIDQNSRFEKHPNFDNIYQTDYTHRKIQNITQNCQFTGFYKVLNFID